MDQVSECLLLNAYSAMVQLYHGENKLIFNEMMMISGHIILIPKQPVLALSP